MPGRRFIKDELLLHFCANAAFGPVERPQLTGRAADAQP